MLGKIKKGKKMSAICFNNVLKTKPKEQLENAATKAKDELAKAQKVLDEYKNKDLSDEKRQLNDKLARLDELNLYVGRVDKNSPNDTTIARLEVRYGKEYQEIVDIVREKIDKENADEVLDISFAPKRSDESASKTNLQNFGKMSQKQQGKSMDLSEFLDENGAVDYGKMGTIDTLPQMRKFKNFVDDFVNDKNAKDIKTNKITFQTPAGNIKIYLPYAYGHFYKNGKFGNKKENRNNLTGALKSILKNPLFVAKDKQGALYFYKPFKDKSGIVDMISVSVDTNGKIQYKTSYADKYNQILSLTKNFEIVYKKGS